jgi:hypothetical protein
LALTAGGQPATPPVAAVFLDGQIQRETAFSREAAQRVASAGYAVQFIDAPTLTNPAALTPQRFGLLVLPQARTLPFEAVTAVRGFLKAGGNLIALGAPLWETPVFHVRDQWISRAQYESGLEAVRPERLLFDLVPAQLQKWTRNSYQRQGEVLAEAKSVEGGPVLHVRMVAATGWETLSAPALAKPFLPGQTLTCFRAKGGPGAKPLMIEWAEEDGSRWIATVALKPQWKFYSLTPSAFKAWTPPRGRGGPADSLNVAKATRLTVGLAASHGADLYGTNEYWLGDIGTARNPYGDFELPVVIVAPHLEALSPDYLFYPISPPVEVIVPPVGWAARPGRLVAGAETLYALHPRPGGAGFDQGRPWRWQPLLEARSLDGEARGTVAVLLVNAGGGTVASFTPNDPEFYWQEGAGKLLQETAARIKTGLFLLEGGAEFFTVFSNQTLRLGARVVNRSATVSPVLTVRLTVAPVRASSSTIFAREVQVRPGPYGAQMVETNWMPVEWPDGGYTVSAALLKGGEIIDQLTHELHVWRPASPPRYVEARDGGFWLEGRPWKAHGVNYMPSSGIGLSGEYFEYWVGKGAYDPAIIERDLRRIKAMNLNAVSVFIYHHSLRAQHLLDFLGRCRALDLRVNLSLRPGTPMDFRWEEMKALIEYYRLAENDTVLAYDLAWEPSHYDQAYQEQHYTKPWQEWVLQRHGSLEKAERTWGVPAPIRPLSAARAPQSLCVPTMQQLTQDGPWRKLAADYRCFLDELLGAHYAEARRLVRTVDAHHPVSFRMQLAGDPTHNSVPLPFDFYGLAGAVDIWEPEAYGRIGDWERVKAGRFTAAYARLCDSNKPFLWAEMGNSVWDMNRMAPNPERIQFTAGYYSNFYRMMIESGADGVFFWWYPGGYRLNERSDYGIINPDGTDRAITKVIRTEGARFLAAPKPPAPDYWIEVDRDTDARGLPGIYEAVKADFWQAVAAGKVPALRWGKRPGS